MHGFLAETDLVAAEEALFLILDAAEVLAAHPPLGRPAAGRMRELVISRGRTGYLALYRYDEAEDRVLIVAIRHQREAGYDPERR